MPVDPLRLKAVFSEALVRTDSSDRAAYLAAACGDDADLRTAQSTLTDRYDAYVRLYGPINRSSQARTGQSYRV